LDIHLRRERSEAQDPINDKILTDIKVVLLLIFLSHKQICAKEKKLMQSIWMTF
jgi:hypothetical protein